MNKHPNSFPVVHSRYATEALTVARSNGMTMRVVGQGDVPLEPFYLDEWWYSLVSAESTIPAEGVRRIDALVKGGVPIECLMIRHEAPRLLTAPKEEKQRKREKPASYLSFDVLPALEAITAVVGAVLAVLGFVFIMAIRLDPALIAVLPDGTWVEVMTWYD
ncbi:MAG: hypothetical protein L0Y56_18350 [Nitrospira sp.]|nr:hypothetical protein [Nitrospira sp.]